MIDESLQRFLYLVLAGVAGSVTGLAFMPWQTMNWGERGFTIAVGLGFAIFGVPWLVGDFLGKDLSSLQAACGAAYAGGTLANTVIPVLLRRGGGIANRWLDKMFGPEDGE